jgi:hypothetical protein
MENDAESSHFLSALAALKSTAILFFGTQMCLGTEDFFVLSYGMLMAGDRVR